jgi:hypothetical protein
VQIPQARICLDPFHVIKWTNEVVGGKVTDVRDIAGRLKPHLRTR